MVAQGELSVQLKDSILHDKRKNPENVADKGGMMNLLIKSVIEELKDYDA